MYVYLSEHDLSLMAVHLRGFQIERVADYSTQFKLRDKEKMQEMEYEDSNRLNKEYAGPFNITCSYAHPVMYHSNIQIWTRVP